MFANTAKKIPGFKLPIDRIKRVVKIFKCSCELWLKIDKVKGNLTLYLCLLNGHKVFACNLNLPFLRVLP